MVTDTSLCGWMLCLGLACIGLAVQCFFIAVEHKKKYVAATVLKGTASLIFVALGFLAMNFAGDKFSKLVFIGLICGAVGDVLLELRLVFPKIGSKIFLVGILVFMAGHILYLCALIPGCPAILWYLLGGAAVSALLLVWILSTVEAKLAFRIFGVFYISAVTLMTALALGNLIAAPVAEKLLFFAGAVLFLVSDVVLIFNTFGKEEKYSLRITNLICYYLGQLLIALSLGVLTV